MNLYNQKYKKDIELQRGVPKNSPFPPPQIDKQTSTKIFQTLRIQSPP